MSPNTCHPCLRSAHFVGMTLVALLQDELAHAGIRAEWQVIVTAGFNLGQALEMVGERRRRRGWRRRGRAARRLSANRR